MLSDEVAESIKNTAKNFQLSKIIDYRKRLDWLNNLRSHGADKYRKFLPKKFRMNIQLLMFNKGLETIVSDLIKLIGPNSINEIYLRYKLNLPEALLLNTFPNADIYVFEDGLGDYIPEKVNLKDKKENIIRQIIKKRQCTVSL